MKQFTLIVEKNKDGFWGQIKEFPDVFSQGDSINDLKQQISEALEIYMNETDQNIKDVGFDLVMDLKQFFEINDFINISKLAERVGMNNSLLRQYSRGIKFPSMKQVLRIEKAVQQIGKELINTHLTAST